MNVRDLSSISTRLAASLALFACATQEQRSAPATTTTRDSAGIAIVDNRGSPRDTVRIADQKPITVIGGANSDDPHLQFGRIEGAVRLSDGRVVMIERAETRWFDASGKYLVSTTANGAGPGEFRFVRTVIRLPGDSVLVVGNSVFDQKSVTFSPDAKLVKDTTLDQSRLRALGRMVEGVFETLPDRSLLVAEGVPGPSMDQQSAPGVYRDFSRIVHVPASLDARHPMGLDGGIEQYKMMIDGREEYTMHPLYSWSHHAAGGDSMRIAIATNPEYAIEI